MKPILSGFPGSANGSAAGDARWRARVDHESMRRMRLRARVPRYCALGAVAVLTFAGARVAIFGAPAPKIERYYQAAAIDIGLEGFAQDYARTYLSWNPNDPSARESALARFNPTLSNELSFQPSRAIQVVTNTQALQDVPAAIGGHIVTVEATLAPGSRTVYLAVPVSRDSSGAMAVTALPSFVGPPSVQESPRAPTLQPVEDKELVAVVDRALTNYLAGDTSNLTADLAPGTEVTYPPNQLQVIGSPTQVTWTGADGVLVTVQAREQQGATYTLSYEIGVVKTERWYVNSIEVTPSH